MAFASRGPTTANSTWAVPFPSRDVKPVAAHPGLFLAVAADLVSISLAFAVTMKLRLALGGLLFARLDAKTLAHLTPPVWLLLVVWVASAWWGQLYRPTRGIGLFGTAIHVVEAMGLATALTILLSFVLYDHGGALSRAFIALLFVVGVICALSVRGVLWLGARLTGSSGRPEKVLIVGDGDDTLRLVNHLMSGTEAPVAVCGVVTSAGRTGPSVPGVPVLGTIDDLRQAVNRTRAERVLVVDTDLPLESFAECLDVCGAMHVPLNYTGGGLTRFPTVVELTEVAGVRLLEVRREEFEGAPDVLKRATDLVGAGALLLVLLPLLAVLAIVIKVTSRGPVLFIDDRVGRGGRHFRCLKFRSMVPGAETLRPALGEQLDGHVFKMPDDPRITAVGRFMRRFSLDELPQLVNVLRGDMTLVGPRPLPARDLDPDGLSAGYRTWSVDRATVKPGLTGLWQIRGRSDLPFEEMVRLDLLYVRTRSYRLDLQILLETVPVVLSGRGAM